MLYESAKEGAVKHFAQLGHAGLLVTAFGLPPFTLKPAAAARRAVAAACLLVSKLEQIKVGCSSLVRVRVTGGGEDEGEG